MNNLWRWIVALLLALPLLFSWLSGYGPNSSSCGKGAAVTPVAAAGDGYCSKDHHMMMRFPTGGAALSDTEKKALDRIAPCITGKTEIEGYTDNVGNDATNLTLSEKRAQAVVKYLASKGVAKEHMVAKGYGETNPIGDNDTPEGRMQNRRIEFTEK